MDSNPPSPEPKPPYEFWAFISYSRKDKIVAKKLHEFIETYGVPVEFVEHPIAAIGEAAPARLRPCFRDIDDLPSGPSLPKALREKLAASRFLVVVCSPNSAASEWVDKEIVEFRALHGEGAEGRIHSFIIAGRPNRYAIDCCFPPSLRDQSPCALNATALGEGDRIARLKLIAAMLGVEPDDIIRRDQERRIKRMKLAVVFALLLVSVLSWFWWQASVAREAEKKAKERALSAEAKTVEQLNETQRQLERSQLEEGRAWLERAKAAENKGDHLSALMLAGRAVGYHGFGRLAQEEQPFRDAFPSLLANHMQDPSAEHERAVEAENALKFLDSVRPTHLPLWAGAMSEEVHCVAFSPDGSRLASSDGDKTIRLWDTTSGKELATLRGHARLVSTVAFSPDGCRLASGSNDFTVKLWDTTSGKELANLVGHTGFVHSVAFSPDGIRLASGSEDETIKIWDTVSGEELASLQGHTQQVTTLAFNSDGSRLASGSNDTTIRLWDAASDKEVAILQGHTSFVGSVAFSPDGTRLASGSTDKTIKIWDTISGMELASIQGQTTTVTCVIFSPDGTLLASDSRDKFSKGAIKLWDVASGKELATFQGHTRPVSSIAFSPDSTRLASSSDDKTIKLWDATSGKDFVTLRGHTDEVASVAFSPDGTYLASSSGRTFLPGGDNTIRLWDTASGKELASLQGHTQRVRTVAFSPDGSRIASASDDNIIKLWDATSGKELANLKGHTSFVWSVAFSPDGLRLASGSNDRNIKLWDTASGKMLSTLEGHTDHVLSVVFSPNGSRLASGSWDKTIKLWDATTGKELASLKGHTKWVKSVAFSPDGTRLASASDDETIRLWDTDSFKEITNVNSEELTAAMQWLAAAEHRLSPDKKLIAQRERSLVFILPNPPPTLDLTAPLRAGLLALPGRELKFPEIKQTTPMLHVRQDTLAQLADSKLPPEHRAELRMELCTKSSQFRAATAQWQRLLQGEWPGFEGATVPKAQAPASVPADSPIRRLYLLALIDATKHPQIHGHPTICQTALQIAPVLTKEMMATPTISLAMMSLMQTLAKDDSPDMSAPRAALLKRLEEVASKEWLAVLREGK